MTQLLWQPCLSFSLPHTHTKKENTYTHILHPEGFSFWIYRLLLFPKWSPTQFYGMIVSPLPVTFCRNNTGRSLTDIFFCWSQWIGSLQGHSIKEGSELEGKTHERHQLNGLNDQHHHHQQQRELRVSSAPDWATNHSAPPPADLRQASRS